MLSHLETDDQWRLMICIAIDNGSDNTVGGSYYSAHQAVGKFLEHTERNTWYILTHLGESGYCLQINPNYQVNWPNCCKFSGQWPKSLWNPGDENHNLPLSLLLNLLYYTIEKCRLESHSDIAFSWKFVLFSIHITLLPEDIYIYTMLAMFVLYILLQFYKVIIQIYLP